MLHSCGYSSDEEWQLLCDYWMDTRTGPCEDIHQYATHVSATCIIGEDNSLLRGTHGCRTPSSFRPSWATPPRMLQWSHFVEQLNLLESHGDEDDSTAPVQFEDQLPLAKRYSSRSSANIYSKGWFRFPRVGNSAARTWPVRAEHFHPTAAS